jgi:hypothetical protein
MVALMWVLYLELFFWFSITILFNAHWVVAQVATVIFTVLFMAVTLGNQNKDEE